MSRSRSLRVAIIKPDWGFRGGGEIAVEHVERLLVDDGHDVRRHAVPVASVGRRPFGVDVPDERWAAAPEYFRHLAVLDAVERLDVGPADLVLSTQPPSYAVNHPKHLSIFFHHLRVFYDLSDLYLAAGFVTDADVHLAAQRRLRALEEDRFDRVGWFCPISETVQERLGRFNAVGQSSVMHLGAGLGDDRDGRASVAPGTGPVLCVSRSEFPKRTELFVHAMKYLPSTSGCLVGMGGRLPWVRATDVRLSSPDVDLDAVRPEELWLNRGEWASPGADDAPHTNVIFAGRVADDALLRRYREAPCVVAPAYDEDYGLTALEAMALGRPVVVASDGGGLTTLVEDGVNGFVVQPSGRAIAEAVERILGDADLAFRLGEGALATAAEHSWARCAAELRTAVERVLSG